MHRIKSAVRTLLNQAMDPYRINDSGLYEFYIRVFLPDAARSKAMERSFYRDLVGSGTVFDIGANVGNKAAIFLRNGHRVICVEPSPASAGILRRRFKGVPNITVAEQACGSHEEKRHLHLFETAAFDTLSDTWSDALGSTSNRSVEVKVATLDSLIAAYGAPSYIKIDVEGFELEAVKGLSSTVPLISFECNLPTFKRDTLEIIDLLSERAPKGLFNFAAEEPPMKLEAHTWLSKTEMAEIVNADRFGYMEIYFS